MEEGGEFKKQSRSSRAHRFIFYFVLLCDSFWTLTQRNRIHQTYIGKNFWLVTFCWFGSTDFIIQNKWTPYYRVQFSYKVLYIKTSIGKKLWRSKYSCCVSAGSVFLSFSLYWYEELFRLCCQSFLLINDNKLPEIIKPHKINKDNYDNGNNTKSNKEEMWIWNIEVTALFKKEVLSSLHTSFSPLLPVLWALDPCLVFPVYYPYFTSLLSCVIYILGLDFCLLFLVFPPLSNALLLLFSFHSFHFLSSSLHFCPLSTHLFTALLILSSKEKERRRSRQKKSKWKQGWEGEEERQWGDFVSWLFLVCLCTCYCCQAAARLRSVKPAGSDWMEHTSVNNHRVCVLW